MNKNESMIMDALSDPRWANDARPIARRWVIECTERALVLATRPDPRSLTAVAAARRHLAGAISKEEMEKAIDMANAARYEWQPPKHAPVTEGGTGWFSCDYQSEFSVESAVYWAVLFVYGGGYDLSCSARAAASMAAKRVEDAILAPFLAGYEAAKAAIEAPNAAYQAAAAVHMDRYGAFMEATFQAAGFGRHDYGAPGYKDVADAAYKAADVDPGLLQTKAARDEALASLQEANGRFEVAEAALRAAYKAAYEAAVPARDKEAAALDARLGEIIAEFGCLVARSVREADGVVRDPYLAQSLGVPEVWKWFSGIDNRGTKWEHPQSAPGLGYGIEPKPRLGDFIVAWAENGNSSSAWYVPAEHASSISPLVKAAVAWAHEFGMGIYSPDELVRGVQQGAIAEEPQLKVELRAHFSRRGAGLELVNIEIDVDCWWAIGVLREQFFAKPGEGFSGVVRCISPNGEVIRRRLEVSAEVRHELEALLRAKCREYTPEEIQANGGLWWAHYEPEQRVFLSSDQYAVKEAAESE